MRKASLLAVILLCAHISLSLSSSLSRVIPSTGLIDYSQAEGILFEDGFESGDFSAWTGTTTTTGDTAGVSQVMPYEENFHGRLYSNGVSSGTELALCYYSLSPGRLEIFARAYFNIAYGLSLDDADDRFGLLNLRDAASGWMMANLRIQRVNGVDKFCLVITSGENTWAITTTDEIYPQQNSWFSIEFYFKVHHSEGEGRVWINGVERLVVTGKNTASYGTIDQVRFGLVSTNVQHSVAMYIDAAVIASHYIGLGILLEDGFESGDFTEWSSTYTTPDAYLGVENVGSYDGYYNARFQTTVAPSVRYAFSRLHLSPEFKEVYVRGYFCIVEGLPLDSDGDKFGLIGFEVGGTLTATFRVHRSNNVDRFDVVGLNGMGSVYKSADAVYPEEGRWYCIEFYTKIHDTLGEYRAWINGVERISITDLNTSIYGVGVSDVRFGLTYTANVDHLIEVRGDCAAVATSYIGPQHQAFGIISQDSSVPAIDNFYWFFGNQNIRYEVLDPTEVTSLDGLTAFDGLVIWTKRGSTYNAAAIRQFAKTHVVISHVYDFCDKIYPSLRDYTQLVTTDTVTYVRDWGNFRNGDLVEMWNETSDTNRLTMVSSLGLQSFANVSQIARYDTSRIAFFHMQGIIPESGFFVMDLHATTPETEWTGIWHLFPAIKMVRDFPTGSYARWMANGQEWWDLDRIYNNVDRLVAENSDVAQKLVIGQSVEGRDLVAIAIGFGSRYAIIDGSMHGNEKTGTFACLRIAELLIEYYRIDPYWISRLSEYKVIIVPVLNPDGFCNGSNGKRLNANEVDLNRQFPPGGTTTEPEAWALRWLMGNYTPTVYINIHEGYKWYPLDMLYGNYEVNPGRTLTINALREANDTFSQLRHWGWFTEEDSKVSIGKVRIIGRGGISSMAIAYASSEYGSSCMILETFLWSQLWDARKCLWGIEYYSAVIISFLQNIDR